MGKWIIKLLLLLCVTTALAACSIVSGPTTDPCNDNGALLRDDFSGEQNCGWREYNQGGAVVEIADGNLSNEEKTALTGDLRSQLQNTKINDGGTLRSLTEGEITQRVDDFIKAIDPAQSPGR